MFVCVSVRVCVCVCVCVLVYPSMHSIREMCGSADVGLAVTLFAAFFADFGAVEASLTTSD